MNLFQWLFVPLCAVLALRTLLRTRRGQLSSRQALVWGLLWTAAALLIAVPGVASWSAATLGIGRGSDLIFYGAILAGLWTFRHFHQRYRQLEIALTEVVRQNALEQATQGQRQYEPAERRVSA